MLPRVVRLSTLVFTEPRYNDNQACLTWRENRAQSPPFEPRALRQCLCTLASAASRQFRPVPQAAVVVWAASLRLGHIHNTEQLDHRLECACVVHTST